MKVYSLAWGTAFLTALRPRQWTKNLIVFAAPLFAFRVQVDAVAGSSLAFILFCCVSSSFYLLNDVIDIKADRLHPVKRHRPIASGFVSVPLAVLSAIVLISISLIIGWSHSRGLGGAIVAYALLQVAYNLKLKRVVILDIFAIAGGFILRAFAGAASTFVILSPWFLICTGMLALFLAIEKRKAELRKSTRQTRSVLQFYSIDLLKRMENLVTVGTVMAYTLWSSGQQVRGATTAWMLLTVPFVLYGVFRYQYLSEPRSEDQAERPEEILLSDRPLQLTLLGWILSIAMILFLKHQNWLIPMKLIG
ncbi:decaprenyl-phosphate phosphoribosyltransferase [Leptolyngbya sp. NIES-2104]|uniref:decaprenyl-phosphate phosphoribosyltransferase n=1 Tax=Leptolyngbya sp. NIES-2104 TaxID=1552121 RepID=UPI0006ECB5BF|nr:decaprenyl-phosphate phosphoribosyltransferase [Leptolyngbya sp. NIES-2104]GAP99462.1 conserved membrane protein, possible 4-hydroxybenzoate octaprenyltranferase [Leptolyngbya sp. NIES-2104]